VTLADVFEDRPELVPWRAELFDLIARTPHLDWLLLTKRPRDIKPLLRSTLAFLEANRSGHCDAAITLRLWLDGVGNDGKPWPPPNVWLGTTVEDQQRADERIPALLEVPAVVHFVSCEPLLERVDLTRWVGGRSIDWVIIGGESGPGARPFHLEWARALVAQCRGAGVAPFVKQLGAVPCVSLERLRTHGSFENSMQQDPRPTVVPEGTVRAWLSDPAGGDINEWPDDLRVREFPEAHRG
jgi:protein gp37